MDNVFHHVVNIQKKIVKREKGWRWQCGLCGRRNVMDALIFHNIPFLYCKFFHDLLTVYPLVYFFLVILFLPWQLPSWCPSMLFFRYRSFFFSHHSPSCITDPHCWHHSITESSADFLYLAYCIHITLLRNYIRSLSVLIWRLFSSYGLRI